ncbi:MAG TPA: T9SS type A sorting domain-containing protein [Ignavibacteriaceae bacterium]
MKRTLIAFVLFIVSLGLYAQSPEWTSFFNNSASANEFIADVAFDNSGNTYLSGYGTMISGQDDDFITVKCNSSGTEEWSKVFNGPQSDDDISSAMFVDDAGNVYVTGISRWTADAFKIVTLKYSHSGNLLWITAFDSLGQSDSRAEDIWVDNGGNIFVTGWISQTNNGYYDIVTIKMNEDGSILDWAYFGQVDNVSDYGSKVIADDNGNVITGGDSFRNVSLGRELVIIKYNSNLDTSWVVHINGSDNSFNEFTVDLALDDTGNVYALCRLQNNPGFTDFAVLKINQDGDVIWRTEFDEAGGQDIPEAMTMDDEGNIFVTGRVRRISGGGYNDFAVIKYNNDGVEQWKSYYDGPNNLDDDPIDVVLDQDGNVFACGESNRDGSYFKFIVVKYNSAGVYEWEYVYDENVNGKAFSMRPDNNGYVYAAGEAENISGDVDLFAVKLSKTTDVSNDIITKNSFELFQNYPNPFNPTTSINWQSPIGGHQTLKVYDVLGNEVTTLIDEYKSAGSYEVKFDASGLNSGVYFYKLRAGSYSQTKKLVLLK